MAQETQTGHCIKLEGWDGEGDGREVQKGGDICILMADAREGNGTPLQYSCLENPMDRGVWKAAVHGVAKSQIRLSGFTFTFHFHVLEKEMATHCGVLAWRIPGTGEPGGLPSMGSHRVGHDWSDLAAAAAAWLIHVVVWWKTIKFCKAIILQQKNKLKKRNISGKMNKKKLIKRKKSRHTIFITGFHFK